MFPVKLIDLIIPLLFLTLSREALGENEPGPTQAPTDAAPKTVQPIYKQSETPSIGYLPHQNYPFFDSYPGYEAYYPQAHLLKQPAYQEQAAAVAAAGTGSNYMSAIIPATQGALQFTLKVLAKFGLFLIGGAVLLLVGGIFTTAVCSLTPICVISFPGFSEISKESVRSLMTPDKISAAAAMVQDAIGKYQRLQRAVGN